MITIKSDKEIKLMREACKLTASVYDYIGQIIVPWNAIEDWASAPSAHNQVI